MTDKPDRQDGDGLLPLISRCYEHGQPDYILAADKLKDLHAVIQAAYGLLWRDFGPPTQYAKEARKALRGQLSHEETRTALQWVKEKYPVADKEISDISVLPPSRDGAEGADDGCPNCGSPAPNHSFGCFRAPPKPAPDAMREAVARLIRGAKISFNYSRAIWIEHDEALRLADAIFTLPAPVPPADGALIETLAQKVFAQMEPGRDRLYSRHEVQGIIRGLSPSPAVAARVGSVAALPLTFWYKNHRGEESLRTAFPISIRFGTTEWHPEAQWLLKAFDCDKQAEREFAMRDMFASPPVRRDREAQETMAAGAIIDVMMGGKFDWRSRIDQSDFLESADWQQAVLYARAALSLSVQPGAGEREADRVLVPREPTQAMLRAATGESPKAIWQAMLTEALK